MKERQRWKAEEDAVLRAYVRQHGPHEWNLVSQRMNVPFNRDAKSCIERWKNYLKPGIKKGSLSEDEQRLVIHLQAKHGNKWKKIAAEVPGRTAKRLGKWWEVFREKQRRESKENMTIAEPLEQGKYDQLLENFAEKLVKERPSVPFLMAAPLLPPWLSNSNSPGGMRSTSPSVTLSLSSSTVPAMCSSWLQQERVDDDNNLAWLAGSQDGLAASNGLAVNGLLASDIVECYRELDEGHRTWMAHKKETAWRLQRVELQLELEKAKKRREKMEEIESKIRALREEQKLTLEMIETDYREQLSILRKNAEAKEQKLADHWASKHMQLSKFMEQICRYGLQ